ncbi:hypothetical protein DPEC_G00345200 [Dallia pectoralis]|uniref:Uncharacterized protein n=1 Tax=Dallia pectoralis TaxID=75939 RepID=A0ACC2F3J0_DALPE|nr:hypothetical protein DPEC_G00345200 [Dallia pectoralis]
MTLAHLVGDGNTWQELIDFQARFQNIDSGHAGISACPSRTRGGWGAELELRGGRAEVRRSELTLNRPEIVNRVSGFADRARPGMEVLSGRPLGHKKCYTWKPRFSNDGLINRALAGPGRAAGVARPWEEKPPGSHYGKTQKRAHGQRRADPTGMLRLSVKLIYGVDERCHGTEVGRGKGFVADLFCGHPVSLPLPATNPRVISAHLHLPHERPPPALTSCNLVNRKQAFPRRRTLPY